MSLSEIDCIADTDLLVDRESFLVGIELDTDVSRRERLTLEVVAFNTSPLTTAFPSMAFFLDAGIATDVSGKMLTTH